MDDREFLNNFHHRSLDSFHHRDHLRLAWLVLTRHGLEEATGLISKGIRSFAASKGSVGLYHETLTRFWVGLVHHALKASPDLVTFESFLAKYPMLLDKSLPYRHWTRETLQSPTAKTAWAAPDILLLPWDQ